MTTPHRDAGAANALRTLRKETEAMLTGLLSGEAGAFDLRGFLRDRGLRLARLPAPAPQDAPAVERELSLLRRAEDEIALWCERHGHDIRDRLRTHRQHTHPGRTSAPRLLSQKA